MSAEERSESLEGIAGSSGIALAPALVVGTGHVGYPRRSIGRAEADAELRRFTVAVLQVQESLQEAASKVADGGGDAAILAIYAAMVGDTSLAEMVEQLIRDEGRCADWAVAEAIRRFAGRMGEATDEYLRDRAQDVEFVGRELLRALGGRQDPRRRLVIEQPAVVVAYDLSPADTAAMIRQPVVGFVTEVGTRTSHTAIMARSLEIPAVLGARDALRRIRNGDLLIVDGLTGRVVIHPSAEQQAEAKLRAARYRAFADRLHESRDLPARTRDGTTLRLLANIELPGEAATALEHGAEGIGLYRTEFLYVDRLVPPSEEQQFETFREVVEAMGERPTTLRTFDIGGDKFTTAFQAPEELNPLLGLRAVRLALAEPEVFLKHLRAMVRASAFGVVRIMVPFVATLAELRAVRRLLDQAREQVRDRGLDQAEQIPLGAMIELPAAAVMADAFAKEADFLDIGTNDLVQYALAVDRTHRALATMASPFHPAILRLVSGVVRAADAADCPVSVCGEMAATPYGALLLTGFGVRELSMEAVAIPEVKETLGRATIDELRDLADQALSFETGDQVRALLEERFEARLHDLLTAELPPGDLG
ncbi:MAG: phosphoenolpyruvate--protein phosphotransferase [Deltaproteobacteria bacterium]|nr:phosphoenolpyruvate--protein phosphotransferase [Deltaproteobacteria bacterium]MBW2537476.1 phosphoenolpyruvate--protein phosphotransferase [Deltaproteobacteria bacterium]